MGEAPRLVREVISPPPPSCPSPPRQAYRKDDSVWIGGLLILMVLATGMMGGFSDFITWLCTP
jgi:hypothetical protein